MVADDRYLRHFGGFFFFVQRHPNTAVWDELSTRQVACVVGGVLLFRLVETVLVEFQALNVAAAALVGCSSCVYVARLACCLQSARACVCTQIPSTCCICCWPCFGGASLGTEAFDTCVGRGLQAETIRTGWVDVNFQDTRVSSFFFLFSRSGCGLLTTHKDRGTV